MPNHIHMLLFVKEALGLPRFMHALSLAYSSYYRKSYKYTGYLWQGRYKSFLIEKDAYLLECARYIERNPIRVKNKINKDLLDNIWSSYSYYSQGKCDYIITPNPLYETFGKEQKTKQLKYKDYILTPRPYENILDDVFHI